jgi:hypothetical protein
MAPLGEYSMKIRSFIQTARDFGEQQILMKFTEGIDRYSREQGLEYEIDYDLNEAYVPCDVALMIGSWKAREKGHHLVRSSIAFNSKAFICIETPLLNRQVHEENIYYRIGVNGFLNNQATFVDLTKNYDESRLQKLGVSWRGWDFKESGHIVILLQLPADASLRGANVYNWAKHIIENLRLHTDRKIIVRPHPLAPLRTGEEFYDFFFDLYKNKIENIDFVDPKEVTLQKTLENAYCSVTYSSGSAIDSILFGIPTISTDPGNFAFDISSHYPEEIDSLYMPGDVEIKRWLLKLAYSQWSVSEMKEGIAWAHLCPIIENIQHERNLPEDDKKKKK